MRKMMMMSAVSAIALAGVVLTGCGGSDDAESAPSTTALATTTSEVITTTTSTTTTTTTTAPPMVRIEGKFRYLDTGIADFRRPDSSCESIVSSLQIRILDGADSVLAIADFGEPETLEREITDLSSSFDCEVTYSANVEPSAVYTAALSERSDSSDVYKSETFNGASDGAVTGPLMVTSRTCAPPPNGCYRI